MEDATSIKQLIQSLVPDGPTVVEGTVTSESPLSITLKNDTKMVLSANSLVVPRYLTDHQVEVDLRKASGILDSETSTILMDGGLHTHGGASKDADKGEHDGHTTGTGEHEHTGGRHQHKLATFDLEVGVLFIYNGLKKGESVLLLQFDNAKRYFVLDRKG